MTSLWDEWNAERGPRYPHEKMVQFTFRAFPPERRAGTRALDLGCGTGVHSVFLAENGFSVVGVDSSPIAVETTGRRLAERGLKADLAVASIDAIDLPPRSLDLVICSGVLDCTGPEVARRALSMLPPAMAPEARGVFMFAAEGDFRVLGENPYGLHGYREDEVQSLFADGFSEVLLDRTLTTYGGGREEQRDWLVTVTR
jgi:SAM-dependent methyltransferase